MAALIIPESILSNSDLTFYEAGVLSAILSLIDEEGVCRSFNAEIHKAFPCIPVEMVIECCKNLRMKGFISSEVTPAGYCARTIIFERWLDDPALYSSNGRVNLGFIFSSLSSLASSYLSKTPNTHQQVGAEDGTSETMFSKTPAKQKLPLPRKKQLLPSKKLPLPSKKNSLVDKIESSLQAQEKEEIYSRRPTFNKKQEAMVSIYNDYADRYGFTALKPWLNEEAMQNNVTTKTWKLALQNMNRLSRGTFHPDLSAMEPEDFAELMKKLCCVAYDEGYYPADKSFLQKSMNANMILNGSPHAKKGPLPPLILRGTEKLKPIDPATSNLSDKVKEYVVVKYREFANIPKSFPDSEIKSRALYKFAANLMMYRRDNNISSPVFELIDYAFALIKGKVNYDFSPSESFFASANMLKQFGTWASNTDAQHYPGLHGFDNGGQSIFELNLAQERIAEAKRNKENAPPQPRASTVTPTTRCKPDWSLVKKRTKE